MSKRELTPPFDGAVDLPVREGWYATAWKDGFNVKKRPEVWPRRYWNGRRFSAAWDKRTSGSFYAHELLWCGLTAPYSI